jgi:hypothetical protein
MKIKHVAWGACALSVLMTAGLVWVKASGIDREYYMYGKFRDSSIKSLLSTDQVESLKKITPVEIDYNYQSGSSAYEINGAQPDRLRITELIGCEKDNSICAYKGGTFIIKTDNEPGDGFAFRTINGELYSFSSGKIRETPDKYKDQIISAVNSVIDTRVWSEKQ